MLTGKTFVDPLHMPFSRRGSYISFANKNNGSNEYGKAQLWLATSRQRAGDRMNGNIFADNHFRQWQLQIVKDGLPRQCVISTTPYELKLESAAGSVSFCIGDLKYAKCRSTDGVTLRISAGVGANPVLGGSLAFNLLDGSWKSNFGNYFMLFVPAAGKIQEGPMGSIELVPDAKGVFEMAMEESLVDPRRRPSYLPYEDCVKAVKADFDDFVKRVAPSFPAKYKEAGMQALWTLWGLMVVPDGETVYKHRMIKMIRSSFEAAFSWQQGMHTMFLAHDLELAWELLLSCFDVQDSTGRIADSLAYTGAGETMKPPVQGLGLLWLMEHYDISGLPKKEMEWLWDRMEKWTRFHLEYRDLDHDGIFENHNPGETGWEDGSYFRVGFPLASPDMNAYLAMQEEALAKLGRLIGKSEKVCTAWEKKSKDTISKIVKMFWTNDGWTAVNIVTKARSKATGIPLYCALVLGKRLPQEVIDRSIEIIYSKPGFDTEFGLASEMLDSPYFSHGWCSGSIATPVEALMAVAFENCGRPELAKKIGKQYLKTMMEHGLFHIHDTFTGELEYKNCGFRFYNEAELFYSGWTAGTYVFFAERYGK
jgi:putative isomerase